MSIEKIISKNPVTIQIDDNLAKVRDIFSLVNFHHLLVIENKKLVGVISERDYLKAVNSTLGTAIETTKDLAALNKKVHQIMSRNVISVNENTSVFDVVSLFNNKNVSCLPVVNDNNYPVGIISWKDVIKVLYINMSKKNTSKTQVK